MASYFDEHDCRPLANGEAPDHLLHLARLILSLVLECCERYYASLRIRKNGV